MLVDSSWWSSSVSSQSLTVQLRRGAGWTRAVEQWNSSGATMPTRLYSGGITSTLPGLSGNILILNIKY